MPGLPIAIQPEDRNRRWRSWQRGRFGLETSQVRVVLLQRRFIIRFSI